MTENFAIKMNSAAQALGVNLSEKQLEQLFTYYEMLVEKNKVMNLTGITEENDVILKHFADSISIAKLFADAACGSKLRPEIAEVFRENTEDVSRETSVRLIDVGTGAGFPGLVLKIVFPGLFVTLFDSLNKRLVFLNEVIEALGLTGVETVHGRAEDQAHVKGYRESFDLAVSRAVANMATLAEYCVPFVKVGGAFVAYKTAEYEEEVAGAKNALKILGAEVVGVESFMLPDSDIGRSLVVMRKQKATGSKYPRKAGQPGSNPLK